jgi:hypothetical protein
MKSPKQNEIMTSFKKDLDADLCPETDFGIILLTEVKIYVNCKI